MLMHCRSYIILAHGTSILHDDLHVYKCEEWRVGHKDKEQRGRRRGRERERERE